MNRFPFISRLLTLLIWLNGLPAFALTEKVVSLESRPGVQQQFLLIQPAEPKAAVVLFAGGHGALDLEIRSGRPLIGWGANNFLVRSRNLFALQKLMVAVMDAPSDCKEMSAAWRMGSAHATDIQAVLAHLRLKANIPRWVVGTSMGTFSAANAAIRLKALVHGLVLTSSITRTRKKWSIAATHPNGIIDMQLETVAAPVLVAAHRDDGCRLTPAADAEKIKNRFIRSHRVQVHYVSGGRPPESDPCHAMSAHGFLGIEEEVVRAIADFITAN